LFIPNHTLKACYFILTLQLKFLHKLKTSFPKEKLKILLLENIHPVAKEKLEEAGYSNVELLKTALPENELIEALQTAKVVGIRSKTKITKNVVEQCQHNLLAVGCFCIGTNQVELIEAAKAGIAVFNSPYSNTRSVAELVMAECVMLLRRIPEKNVAAHKGDWLKTTEGSYELRGKTLGIVGYGHIGSQVSILAEAFGMKVLYYDVVPKLPLGNAVNAGSLKELLSQSDIVTLHVPEESSTKNMADANFFSSMKSNAIFLNLSRGTVVDIDALAETLKNKRLAGAAVDVYPVEPKGKGEKFESALQGIDNVILTPHIGGSTNEAQYNIAIDAATKIINYLDKGNTVGSHSIPALNLPMQQGTHRILHIHNNIPGVMSAINNAISSSNTNIVGQYLKTNESIGYVVIDIDESDSSKTLEEMKKVEGTIRTRILF